jgi:membrane-bound lytic murein transglycosylase D
LLKIAQVESNWKPFALSSKGAFGLWQLMPATARRYGLRVDGTGDDRSDTGKATRVAARYLRDLHERFGDWALALAAYNAGEDAVEKAIERGASRDFWNLSQRKLLPEETRAYVPAVLASFGPSGTQRAIGLGVKSNGKFVEPRIMYAAARQVPVADADSKGRF